MDEKSVTVSPRQLFLNDIDRGRADLKQARIDSAYGVYRKVKVEPTA